MYCPKCSAQNPDDAVECGFCGTNLKQSLPPRPQVPPGPIPPQGGPTPPGQYRPPGEFAAPGTGGRMGAGGYPAPPPVTYGPKPANNLVGAILVTILCCVPGGIVSIVYAAKVDGLWAAGDYTGAVNSAKTSRTWMYAAIGVGLVVNIIYVAAMFAGGMGSATHSFPR